MNLQEHLGDLLQDELLASGVPNVDSILEKYCQLCEKSSAPLAFKIMHVGYSQASAERTSGLIKLALEKANREHPGVQTNALKRLKAAVNRFNEKLSKVSVLLNGREALLTEQELDAIRAKMPACLEPQRSEALASIATAKARLKELEFVVLR